MAYSQPLLLEVGSDSGPTGRVLRVSGRVQDPDPTPWTRHLFGSGSDPTSRVLRSTILATNHPAGSPYHTSTNSYVKTWVRPGPEGFGSGSGYPRVRPEPEGSGSGSDPKPENASGPGRIQPLDFLFSCYGTELVKIVSMTLIATLKSFQ